MFKALTLQDFYSLIYLKDIVIFYDRDNEFNITCEIKNVDIHPNEICGDNGTLRLNSSDINSISYDDIEDIYHININNSEIQIGII